MSNTRDSRTTSRRCGSCCSAETSRKARMRRNRAIGIWAVMLVIVAVISLVAVSSLEGVHAPAGSASPASGETVSPAILSRLQSIALKTLVSAPAGGLDVRPGGIKDPRLTSGGKPELLYIGAEFCPVCATERWAMFIALSKFGTFVPQPGEIHSALRDGDIQTLTFYKTKYSSPYLSFTPVETTTNQPDGDYYVNLQDPTPTELQLWKSHTGESFPVAGFRRCQGAAPRRSTSPRRSRA